MRRILLIVAMLMIAAAPAMATVTVSAKHIGMPVKAGVPCTTCEVNYVCSGGEKVRAFALEITVDNSYTITGIRDFNVGESNKAPNAATGYGIFPGKFRDWINPADPNWADINYSPIAPVTDADAAGTGLGTNKIIVELGSLYVGDNNAPQGQGRTSGVLFRFDIMGKPGTTTNIAIASNATRGGVVLEDGNTITALTTPALSLVGHTGAGLTDSFPCYGTWTTQYNEWLGVYKPKCWSGTYLEPADVNWRSQCWGDNDGKYEGASTKYRVFNSDYTRLVQAWSKRATALRAGMGTDGNWMCADYDHKYEGTSTKYRVFNSDYARLLQGWAKRETVIRNMYGWCPQ